jgi:hypothetical protein
MRLRERHGLRRQRLERGEDTGAGFLDRNHQGAS